jgi:hypothetical protein
MPRISFDELPDHGRLWVFPASPDLTDSEAEACLTAVDEFLSTWSAHGAPLRSGRELIERRFLLVGVDVDAESPSGCSIDALVNRLRALGESLGVVLIDHASVWFRDGSAVRTVSRAEFRNLAAEGEVDAGVSVFDTTLTRVDQVRRGALERPASESWHGRAFFGAHARG